MFFQGKLLTAMTAGAFMFAVAGAPLVAGADVLCGPNGWSCTTTAYPCEDIEVPEGSRCFGGLMPQGAIEAKDIKSMLALDAEIAKNPDLVKTHRRKPKVSIILPDPKIQKSSGCPPVCLEKPVPLPEEPIK